MSAHDDLGEVLATTHIEGAALYGIPLAGCRALVAEHNRLLATANAARESAAKLRAIDVQLHTDLLDLIDAVLPLLRGEAAQGERHAAEHLVERLLDLDHKFQLWRYSHMKTVERIIGYKRGTGGTGGVSYLAKLLELQFFPELWSIRTAM